MKYLAKSIAYILAFIMMWYVLPVILMYKVINKLYRYGWDYDSNIEWDILGLSLTLTSPREDK